RLPGVIFFCISDTLVPTTYLVDTTLSDASDYDQTVHAVRLRFQGLALYNFESEITGFVSNGGKAALRLGGEYDVLLTNRLILQPSYEVNFYSQDDESRGRGRGLTDTELGLRLRYEIRREFAPYIGVSWNQLYGKTSDMAKREGEKDHQVVFLAGARIWF
ncbi:copper resistance protein B, partial [Klebsiella pneumoniae]